MKLSKNFKTFAERSAALALVIGGPIGMYFIFPDSGTQASVERNNSQEQPFTVKYECNFGNKWAQVRLYTDDRIALRENIQDGIIKMVTSDPQNYATWLYEERNHNDTDNKRNLTAAQIRADKFCTPAQP